MTTTAPPRPRRSTVLSNRAPIRAASHRSVVVPWRECAERRACKAESTKALARYLDREGRRRELVVYLAAGGSRLVVDRDSLTRADRRLIAHLASDEPAQNAELVCSLYLRRPAAWRCRQLLPQDLHRPALTELEGLATLAEPGCSEIAFEAAGEGIHDRAGNRYQLVPVQAKFSIPELRWCRTCAPEHHSGRTLCLREVVGAIENYEPARSLTAAAVHRHYDDPMLSVSTIAAELQRLNRSRIVLNRGLREAVLAVVDARRISMSEIALRCGRVKRDRHGGLSGETTWLARRLGLACEGGAAEPSPWVHSDVLALIARRGIGIAPREAELG